ncbi:PREDICTED: uncharacterized protein LOC106743975 [Dinoponera quadriceps]|uniref:Uncharacterized protein LOC106743975 n=1 Tax=Dinoponera quadriceps TaxID=609295 RepID=A0A6P3X694_DINQU|nr:PREDICTED: uncharacterized protein LOC106743975 [Dinoponera quadriceps]
MSGNLWPQDTRNRKITCVRQGMRRQNLMGNKRSGEEPSTSNFSGVKYNKKTNVTSQTSFIIHRAEERQHRADYINFNISKIIRIAIAPVSYPDKRLKAQEIDRIKDVVLTRILCLAEGTKPPIFQKTYERDGVIIFDCMDNQTSAWLKSLMSEITFHDGTGLRLLRMNELPKRNQVVRFGVEKITIKDALQFLSIQNPGLSGEDWKFVGCTTFIQPCVTFIALIKSRNLRILRDVGFKPYCGLSRLHITPNCSYICCSEGMAKEFWTMNLT